MSRVGERPVTAFGESDAVVQLASHVLKDSSYSCHSMVVFAFLLLFVGVRL